MQQDTQQNRHRSLIGLYLQKVSTGDSSFVERLCYQLADRLVYSPVIASPITSPGQASGSTVKVSVLRLNEAHRSLVFLFTSEESCKAWAEKSGHSGQNVALLGADFCSALDPHTWVVVDAGTSHSVQLQPSLVAHIASVEPSVDAEEVQTPETEESDVEVEHVDEYVETPQAKPAQLSELEAEPIVMTGEKLANPPRQPVQYPGFFTPGPHTNAFPPEQKAATDSPVEKPVVRLSQEMVADSGAGESSTSIKRTATLSSSSLQRPVIFSSAEKKPVELPPEKPKQLEYKTGKSFLSFLKGK